MANKRQLKKHIQAVCGELAAEILITRHMFEGFDDNKVNDIVNEIAVLQETTLANCTFAFDKVCKDFASRHDYNLARSNYYRAAYRHLLSDFSKGVLDVVKKMNEALPADVKNTFKSSITH